MPVNADINMAIEIKNGFYYYTDAKSHISNCPNLNNSLTIIKYGTFILAIDIFGNIKSFSSYYKKWIDK